MADNTITLLCLLHGDHPDQIFKVIIDKNKDYVDLRNTIKRADSRLSTVGTTSIRLWKVNIDYNPPMSSPKETLLNNFTENPRLDIERDLGGQKLDNFDTPLVGQNGYWSQTPPPMHIHVIFEVTPRQLTEKEFLMLRPPPLSYCNVNRRKKLKPTTTNSTWAHTPCSVVPWHNFMYEVTRVALEVTCPRYNEPTFLQYKNVSGKEGVRDALNVNVLRPLSRTIGLSQMPHEDFRRLSVLEDVKGKPDFILIREAFNPLLILAIEVKTKWDLNIDDIVRMYQDNLVDIAAHRSPGISVIDPIKQIYGYMGHNKLQYGVLTTYDKTWFLWRPQDNPGELRISTVVDLTTNSKPTLLQCFAYIMSLARQAPDSPLPPELPSPPKFDNGKGGSQKVTWNKQSKEVLKLEDFGWSSFDFIDVLGNGCCGTVFKATLRGEEVALKLCDLWQFPEYEEEMITEVKVYMALEQLQGRFIPRLKGAGYTAGGLFAIATEIMGSPIEVKDLSYRERNEIVNILLEIHRHGILHNDIRPENILIQRRHDRFEAIFIDFACSKLTQNKKELDGEMVTLKRMLCLPSNGLPNKPRRSPRLNQISDQDPR